MASQIIMFLYFSLSPLFPGTNELDQVTKIHDVLGTPDSSLLQKFRQYVSYFGCIIYVSHVMETNTFTVCSMETIVLSDIVVHYC